MAEDHKHTGDRPLVVCVGAVEVDFLGKVHRLPDSDSPAELDEISVQVGGSGAIAIATAAALGCRSRFACKLADEFIGTFILHALREAGIETRGVLAKDRILSGLRFSIMTHSNERMTFFSHGDVDELDRDEIDVHRLLDGAHCLILDGTQPSSQLRVAETARERKIPIVFDGSTLAPHVGELVALADILICSERLAGELAPQDELETAMLELQKLGPSAVIMTMGEGGSIGLHGDQLVRQPAYRVEDTVDVAGAGAVYHGAFVAALLSKLPFARCMEFASVAAGLSCRSIGAWAGIPTRSAVIDAIRSLGG